MVTEGRNLNAMKWNLSHAQGFFGRPKELCTTNWRRSFCICLCSCVTLSKFAPTNTSCSVFLHIVGGGWPLLVLLFFVGESFPKEGYRWFEISGNKNVDKIKIFFIHVACPHNSNFIGYMLFLILGLQTLNHPLPSQRSIGVRTSLLISSVSEWGYWLLLACL